MKLLDSAKALITKLRGREEPPAPEPDAHRYDFWADRPWATYHPTYEARTAGEKATSTVAIAFVVLVCGGGFLYLSWVLLFRT